MRKLYPFLLVSFSLFSTVIYADIDPDDVGPENIETPLKEAQSGPFKFRVLGDYIGKAKVKNSWGFHKLTFGTVQAEAGLVYYYDECINEAANVTVFYENTVLDWKSNPYFNQTDYSTAGITLGATTQRLPNWTWNGQLSISFDNLKYWNFSDYMYYDILLWGRYEFCDNIGVHIGFFAETGMKIDLVYPVIGVDWTYNEHWKVSAVFPLNVSIVYSYNKTWSFDVAARFFDERNRLGKNQYLSQGLWHYQSTGAEVGINFTPGKWISANIHAGTTVGGRLKIADKNYNHRQRIRLDPAPYAGGEIEVNF